MDSNPLRLKFFFAPLREQAGFSQRRKEKLKTLRIASGFETVS
jgi:hypothetical protein